MTSHLPSVAVRGAAGTQIAVLGLLFVALAVLVDSTYAIVAGRLLRRLRASPRAQRNLSTATSGVYLAFAGVAVIA